MAAIRHCGVTRKTVSYWLLPRGDATDPSSEKACFKSVVLLASTCPKCNSFVMEWYGINHKGLSLAQNRIKLKHHDEWILRTLTDRDDQQDASAWGSNPKSKIYLVKGSKPIFPWTFRTSTVR